jgi:23S rRNA (pseudouridine1915-N3)-methyltransferase
MPGTTSLPPRRAILLLLVCGLQPMASFMPSSVVLPATPRQRASISCGPRVTIYSVGKTKETWLQSAIELYRKRLRTTVEVDCVWVRDDSALEEKVAKCTEACIILDERGHQCTSVEFTKRLYDGLEDGGSRLSFFIGGADGLPPALKADPKRLLSLSKLTFTHQMARLLLVEQIYRATEIRKGSGYHKD